MAGKEHVNRGGEIVVGKEYVVLQVLDSHEDYMTTYSPQVASIQEYGDEESAAAFNVGSHPDAEARGKPYRVVVVPAEAWLEFEVFSESERGRRHFKAYPSEHPTLGRHNDS
jgi:hypothetical protein